MFEKFRMNCGEDEDVIQGNKSAPKCYTENFRPYSCNWFAQNILPHLNLNQFDI
ncbi:hypothetical protein [Pigmentibacter ruber]|uniref:hypothetical protein n=1 Tax=Pigmentibacter ruber TaxID=2683196 RepID=UPI00131A9268|nr:hypothetical protein [Pigmentibacter ruber]